ncbi:MAG TPA: hypothetical protein VML75_26010 [Kofleriaceae bacterium]|nr:hypothetical protein [Kofleriaceae bacterium]
MMKRLHVCALALAMSAAGCSKKDDADKKNQIDPGGQPAKVTDTQVEVPAQKDLPPPPPEAMEGHVRVVNVYVSADGKSQAVDVWAKRSFQYGPVKLAENIELGEASPWFQHAKGQSLAVFPAGSGPDGEPLSSLGSAQKGEHVTNTLMLGDRGPSVTTDWESKATEDANIPKAPEAGKGLVVIGAYALRAHEKTMDPKFNPSSFFVGDGAGKCVRQRVEDKGFSAAVLGGTNKTLHDLPPGKATFTLHKWPGKPCDGEPLYTFEVDVQDGKGTLVVLYTPDGKDLANAQFELALK